MQTKISEYINIDAYQRKIEQEYCFSSKQNILFEAVELLMNLKIPSRGHSDPPLDGFSETSLSIDRRREKYGAHLTDPVW